jgi:hypothetical protein
MAINSASSPSDQAQYVRDCQQKVAKAYEDVHRGKPGAVERWNAANRELGQAHQQRWRISAGLAMPDDDR